MPYFLFKIHLIQFRRVGPHWGRREGRGRKAERKGKGRRDGGKIGEGEVCSSNFNLPYGLEGKIGRRDERGKRRGMEEWALSQ